MARNPNDPNWRDYEHPAMNYQAPKQLRRFRASMVLAVSTLLVAGLYTALWFGAAQYVKSQVAGWIEGEAARGATAAYESLNVSGFPSRIVLNLAQPSYADPLGLQWNADGLTLSARPWLPWRLHGEAPGRHAFAYADGSLKLSGKVAMLNADVTLGSLWPEALSVELEGVDMTGTTVVRMDTLSIAFTHDARVKASGVGATLQLAGVNLTLPLGGGLGLGDRIEHVDVSLRVDGPVLPGELQDRLAAWRDVGGAVQVERLKMRYGPMAVAAVGTIALDDAFQPVGALTAKFEGLFQVLENLRALGFVRDGDAVVATMALSALSKRPPDGGPPAINLAVSVQDGKLSLGPISVMTVPMIDWGFAESAPEFLAEPEPERDYKNGPTIY